MKNVYDIIINKIRDNIMAIYIKSLREQKYIHKYL